MPTSSTIESITNLGGLVCAVTISGIPSGTFSVIVARNMEGATQYPAAFTGTYPTYNVTVPYNGLWYFWLEDSNGISTDFEACNVTLTGNIVLDEIGLWLRDRLDAHRKGLDVMLQMFYPDSRTKQIEYGIPENLTQFPSILITDPRSVSNRYGLGFLMRHDYFFQIVFIIQHSDEQTDRKQVVRWAEMAKDILNQSTYSRVTLPCGATIWDCLATEVNYIEQQMEGAGWFATGTVKWSASRITQEKV